MQIQRRRLVLAAMLGAGTSLLAACGGGGDDAPTITGVVQARPEFSLLSEAVVAADLAGTLSSPGPYTVFAPTNDAFAALLAETGLTKEQLFADKALLTAVLTYHVLPGRVDANGVADRLGQPITTVNGSVFKVESSGGLKVTDGRNRVSGITATNVAASNGVIHVVDRVLLPPNRDIVQTAQATPSLSILVEAVVAADLAGTLAGPGPFTVFAPTDDAFAALLAELGITKAQLLADKPLLQSVLGYHVVSGRVLKAQVPIGAPITTLEGGTFTVAADLKITDERARVSGIATTDVFATNGVVHVIDRVLLPA